MHATHAPSSAAPRAGEAGFTLLEIMVVVLIVGMLTVLVSTTVMQRYSEAQHDMAATRIKQIATQLEFYKLHNGRYPTTEQGLEALIRAPTSEPRPRKYQPGGYLKEEVIFDPWDEPYYYERPGQHNTHSYDLYSYGADGVEGGDGTDADVSNWNSASE